MATYSDTRCGVSPLAILFVLAAVGLLWATLRTPAGKVKTTKHAVERHGAEAGAIRDCLQRKGPQQVWQDDERDDIQFWCVELDPPGCGVFGLVIAQVFPSVTEGCDWRERSSYIPADGRLENVVDYLSRFAHRIR